MTLIFFCGTVSKYFFCWIKHMNSSNSDDSHPVLSTVAVCKEHPDRVVIVYPRGQMRCVKPENLNGGLPPLPNDAKPESKQEQSGPAVDAVAPPLPPPSSEKKQGFKRPDEIRADAEQELLELRLKRRGYMREWIGDAIHRMVAAKETTCTRKFSMAMTVTSDDYAQIRDELKAAGYTAVFLNAESGEPLITPSPPPPQRSSVHQLCECPACIENREGGEDLVAREIRRVRQWALSVMKPESSPSPQALGFITVEVQVSIAAAAADASSPKVQSEHQEQQHRRQGHGSEWTGKRVLELFLTMHIVFLLFVYSLVPVFVPRFLAPVWGIFAAFVLLVRFVRWKEGAPIAGQCRHERGKHQGTGHQGLGNHGTEHQTGDNRPSEQCDSYFRAPYVPQTQAQ